MGGSALQKVPPNARRLVGRLVRATGQDQNKKDLNNGRLSLHPYAAIGSPRTSIGRSEQTISGRRPLGEGGGQAWGMGGGFGVSRPGCSYFGEAAVLAGTMPASWRGACRTGHHAVRPDECEVRVSTRRDREAATRQTTQHCATLYSVERGTAQREVSPRRE